MGRRSTGRSEIAIGSTPLRRRGARSAQAKARLEILARLIRDLAGCEDKCRLLEILLRETPRLMDMDALGLALRGHTDGHWASLLVWLRGGDEMKALPPEFDLTCDLGEPAFRALRGESVLVRPATEPDGREPTRFEELTRTMASQLWVPLRSCGQILGALSAQSREPGRHSEEDLRLLASVADVASPVLQRVRPAVGGASDAQVPHASLTADLVAGHNSLSCVVENIYRDLPRYLGFSRASLMLYDEESQSLISDELIGVRRPGAPLQSAPQPVGYSISGKCFSEGKPIVIDDCSRTDLVPREFVERLSLKSVLAVPVVVRGNVIGVLRVDDSERTHRFGEKDVEFFSTLAELLGIVATNPRLLRELREAEATLRESERNFRALADNANDGILIAVSGGDIVYANSRAGQLTGHGDLTTVQLRDLVPIDVRGAVLEWFRQILAGKLHSRRQHETTFRRPDGQVVPIELSVTRTVWRGEPAVLAIVRDITERRRLEKEVLETSEKEQTRIGRDLHDGLGQTLAAIGVKCKVLERKLADLSPAESADAAQIVQLVRHALDEAHGLARGLSPVHLESRGLALALRDLAADLESTVGTQCCLISDAAVETSDATVATQLYRIAQEAVGNAIRHGSPQKIQISLHDSDETITLTVQDDGTGFDPAQSLGGGMGLQTMKYRARMIGADLAIESGVGQGVTVRCTLPGPTVGKGEEGRSG